MKKFLHFLRILTGIICAVFTLTYVVLFFTETESDIRVPFAVLAVIFGLFTFLCFRRKKAKRSAVTVNQTGAQAPISVTISSMDVPKDILRDMRKYYTKAQAIQDARIMQESFYLAQHTTDFDVFLMRSDLARKKALTLEQARMAKCRGIKSMHTEKATNAVLNSTQALKIDFLFRTYDKEMQSALQLKTLRGQHNRLEKFLEKLKDHEDDFLDTEQQYNEVLNMVLDRIPETKKTGEV